MSEPISLEREHFFLLMVERYVENMQQLVREGKHEVAEYYRLATLHGCLQGIPDDDHSEEAEELRRIARETDPETLRKAQEAATLFQLEHQELIEEVHDFISALNGTSQT